MAFTTPATAVAGTALTAAWLNTYVRDNLAWMATDSPACRAYNNANISIGNSSDTAVTMNSERFDNAAMHSTSSNTSRITVPTGGGGKYLMGSLMEFAANATGERGNHLRVNATTFVSKQVQTNSGGIINWTSSNTSVYALSAADYIECYVFQNSGGNLNLAASGNWSPEVWMFWIRT